MKKFLLLITALTAGWFCCGGTLDINGNFASLTTKGMPRGWRLNTWHGYQPLPQSELLSDAAGKVLHIFKPGGKRGFGLYYAPTFPAAAGDIINVKAQVKGKGNVSFAMQLRNEAGRFLTTSHNKKSFKLTDDWKTVLVKMPVTNPAQGETARITITISCSKDSELFIRNISAEQESSDIAGSAPFPREWLLFAPVDANAQIQTDKIPASINGTAGKRSLLSGSKNTLDFSPFFPKRQLRNTGWAFAVMNSPTAEKHTFGIGADYFFALYVNGKKVFDTLERGNAAGNPPHFTDYKVTVPLKKGANILAVKFQSGRGPKAHLCIGGANDLRGLSSVLAITKKLESDDYERSAVRPGDPKLIKDIISPGWLTTSTQAVYSAGQVKLNQQSAVLPPSGSELYLAGSIRIQSFSGQKAEFSLGKLTAVLRPKKSGWTLSLLYSGKQLKSLDLPSTALPADLTVAVKSDYVNCTLVSLGDSKVRSISARTAVNEKANIDFTINAAGKNALLTVDNYLLGYAVPETKSTNIPFKVDIAPEFDPVKAGWKMVWNDEFDGSEVDLKNKWFIPVWNKNAKPEYLVLKDGILRLRCEMKAGEKRPSTVGIRSRQLFRFGYFEARVRFTSHPGWWAAFWMLTNGGSMTTGGGCEMDVFEDYATRRADRLVANNYHSFMGSKIKSYSYTFKLPGSLDDFYVIGLKWTPFESSVYLNGKLIKSSAAHSPWQSLTYDALHHAFPTAPTRVIVSGQCGKSGGRAAKPFMEEYLVDYVRVYEYPQDELPQISFKNRPRQDIVKTGTVLKFSADAKANAKSKSPITGVYLFDNGYLVDYKKSAPYNFELPLTQERYDMCAWGRAGKSTAAPQLDGYAHSFQLAVQDASGKVAFTSPIPLLVIDKASTPYKGRPAVIPGTIKSVEFDEGGGDVAYYNAYSHRTFNRKRVYIAQDGSWLRYTVNVKRAGTYKAVLNRLKVRDITRGTNFYPDMQLILFVNDKIAGTFQCRQGETSTVLENIKLPAGEVKLTVMALGGHEMSYKDIVFTQQ